MDDVDNEYDAQIKDYETKILEINLEKISTDVKLEYNRINPSGKIDDLNIPKGEILNAIFKYGEMLKAQTDAKRQFSNYKIKYRGVEGLETLGNERSAMSSVINALMVRTYDVNQVYDNFIEFFLKITKVLIDIVNNSKNPWTNLFIPYKAELIEIVYRRLIACTDLLESCNDLQETVLNILNPMIEIFDELGDTSTFQRFLDKYDELIAKQKMSLMGHIFRHKIDILLRNKGTILPQKNQIIYEKRKKFNEEEISFKQAIKDWKKKAYNGGKGYDSSSSVSSSPESTQKRKKIKFSII